MPLYIPQATTAVNTESIPISINNATKRHFLNGNRIPAAQTNSNQVMQIARIFTEQYGPSL